RGNERRGKRDGRRIGERGAVRRAFSRRLQESRRDPRRCLAGGKAYHIGRRHDGGRSGVKITIQFLKYVTVAALAATSDWVVFTILLSTLGVPIAAQASSRIVGGCVS